MSDIEIEESEVKETAPSEVQKKTNSRVEMELLIVPPPSCC
jgi:hypothetical protein